MSAEISKSEITKFAVGIVGVLRGAAAGIVFIKGLQWTPEEFNLAADKILADLRSDKVAELRELYENCNGEPFKLWEVRYG
jgi:hypothetical protein